MRVGTIRLFPTSVIENLRPEQLANDPGTPTTGQVWYNTTSKALKFYDGAVVHQLAVGGALTDYVRHDGTVAMTGDLTLLNSTPSNVLHAASKGYVDAELAAGLALKENVLTGAATTIAHTNLTADRVLISDASGKVAASTDIELTELNYLNGLTSNVQNQIDSQVSAAGDTMTGNLNMGGTHTVSGLAAPVNADEAATKGYVDAALAGLDFQPDVLAKQADATLDPGASPAAKARYIVSNSAALHANFGTISGVADNDIVEWNGTAWVVSYDVSAQGEGAITWNRAQNYFEYWDGATWTEFGGLSSLTAGVGLVKDHNTIHVNLGAGIKELPTDEVGIEVYSAGGLMTTVDGVAESTDTAATLSIKLNGATLHLSGSGVKIADSGVTEVQLNASVAGAGLTGGAGSALAVGAGTSMEVGADSIGVAAAGITEVQLNASVAGAGLVGGAGVALAVGAGNSMNVTADAVGVADAGITPTQLNTSVAGNGLAGGAGVALTVDTAWLAANWSDARYIDTAGDTMTGALVLAGDPTAALQAATKQYVDAVATRLTQSYFVYTAASAATSHTVAHNMGNQYVNVTVVDSSDQVIIPDSITFTDSNTVTVVLAQSETCKVVVSGLKA